MRRSGGSRFFSRAETPTPLGRFGRQLYLVVPRPLQNRLTVETVVSADHEIRYIVFADKTPKRHRVYPEKVSDLINRHDRRVHTVQVEERALSR